MKNLVIDSALWHSEPCSKFHCPCVFICKYLLQRVISLAQGLEFLLHFWCWVLTLTLLRYPVVALCCGYPEALGLRGRVSSRAQADHRWGECWGRSSHIYLWSLPGELHVWSTCWFPCPHHQDDLHNIVLANSPLSAMSKG